MTIELLLALEQLGAEPVFDGPRTSCPVCRQELEQLRLALELEADTPVSCGSCGVVLAA
jgi:hypothetical protein